MIGAKCTCGTWQFPLPIRYREAAALRAGVNRCPHCRRRQLIVFRVNDDNVPEFVGVARFNGWDVVSVERSLRQLGTLSQDQIDAFLLSILPHRLQADLFDSIGAQS